jgi:hypothetical protein
MTLDEAKAAVERDIRRKIEAGEPLAGELLPKDPVRIDVVGRAPWDMQVRVVYADRAPFYFDVTEAR